MKFLSYLALSAALLTLMGCPYHTEHALGTPGADKVDVSLIGHWTNGGKSQLVNELTIDTADAYELNVNVLGTGTEFEEQTLKFFGFTTKHADTDWVYFWADRADGPEGYYYMTYRFDEEGNLITQELNEDKAKAANPSTRAEFKEYIEKNLAEGEIMNEEIMWTRMDAEEKAEKKEAETK